MKLGDMIKSYRSEHQYSLREFADLCGISFSQIRLMESGTNTSGGKLSPTIDSLKAVAKGMGISLTSLLENCDDMEIEWNAGNVSIAPEKQALIDRILIADSEQLRKIKTIIDLVMS